MISSCLSITRVNELPCVNTRTEAPKNRNDSFFCFWGKVFSPLLTFPVFGFTEKPPGLLVKLELPSPIPDASDSVVR